MAIIQEKTNSQGVTGNYWRILQHNDNSLREDSVVEIDLYLSEESRLDGNVSGLDRYQFVFNPDDHPMSEFDVDSIEQGTYDTFPELELHIRYTHIMNIATIANTKTINSEKLTPNEDKALFFFGGIKT